ncbi:MAG: roadblock/LC7 domain-containing protein [Planctomycetes bacterium]|nr:roadblock/LC7 domain-containing protein [Planctomycetota bacterium]
MSKIQEALTELRRAPGVKGGALVTADGLMVAQSLDPRFHDEAVAGLTSFLLSTTCKSLADGGMGTCERFVLHATHGRAVFAAVEESFLVVLLDQFADFDGCKAEIDVAVQQLRRSSRLQ